MLTKLLNFVALVCFAIAIAFIFTVHLAQKKPSNNPSNYLKIKAMIPIAHNKHVLDSWVNRDIILGLRPEQISDGFPNEAENDQIHSIESRVDIIEPTGPDTLVFVKINEKKVTCRVHPNAAKRPGETMKLMLDMSSAIFFDPNTELQIS